ncbi:MAG: MBL fold metallo-hydrolase [Clostridia bacterium]|nr:MBL fold metallo-hydrolase [Clostridia bacterium]
MYELIRISEKCYYIESPAKIGLIKLTDSEICLIDSGSDKDAAKKALKIIDENGWTLKAVYNTHSHADHIGGNRLIQSRTGCDIFAPGIECDFTNHPILESAFLYGGFPPKELNHKFLLAEESVAKPLSEDVMPEGLEIIPLKGHSFDMVGFKSSDGVVYLADALSSSQTLDKYGIGFIYDVGEYLKTLQMIKEMEAQYFIPSHAEPCKDIGELAQYNIDKVYEIANNIIKICAEPCSFEQILKQIFNEYSLKMSFEQYALVGSALKSYLSWLKGEEKLETEIRDNMIFWKSLK